MIMKRFIGFLLVCFSLSALGQKAITFDVPNGKMLFTESINGQNVIKNYAIAQCFFTYEAALNRISLYFNSVNQQTIYSGSFSSLKVSGKTATAEKLAELNLKLSVAGGGSGGGNGSGTSTSPTYTLTTVTAHNGEFSTTYTIPATAVVWVVCNVGSGNATLSDGTSNESVLLRPGQCISDEIKYRNDTNQAIRVSPVTIVATGTICSFRWK